MQQALKVHDEEQKRASPAARRELAKEHDAELDALETILSPPVWKSTTGLGGPHQTSELSSSVKSKSIRLIFGRIDCSHPVLEAQPKSVRRNIQIRAH